MPPKIYKNAITGTNFSVTFTNLATPPRKTAAAHRAITIPIPHAGMPNALWQVSAIEFA